MANPCATCAASRVSECPKHWCSACLGVGLVYGGETFGEPGAIGHCPECFGVLRDDLRWMAEAVLLPRLVAAEPQAGQGMMRL